VANQSNNLNLTFKQQTKRFKQPNLKAWYVNGIIFNFQVWQFF
jgi:hypothetical protein